MKDLGIVLMIILGIIILFALILGIQGLVIWGIGNFVCWAFQIPYTFTFVHGIACALILSLLEGLFTINIKKEN